MIHALNLYGSPVLIAVMFAVIYHALNRTQP